MSFRLSIVYTMIGLFIIPIVEGQSIMISGRLLVKGEGKAISNGVIFLAPDNQVISTNAEGEYSFTSSPGNKQISTQVLGYLPERISFEANSDTLINIYAQVSLYKLSEVTVTGDSIRNIVITNRGSFILTPKAIREIPRLFSEPDLLKSFQLLPGVVSGKDGSADIYVRGGGPGQNVVLANGCSFFLPNHLLGFASPYDLDFLESAELLKDYIPSEMGGGASSVINLEFRGSYVDSLRAQLRLGVLSSGVVIELPIGGINSSVTAGVKRGNYSIYAPLLKKMINSDVADYLPPENYSFYDGYLRFSHNSRLGGISYLFFGNYDNGKDESITHSSIADTLNIYTEGISTGWRSMVHAFQWDLPANKTLKWRLNVNFSKLSIGRDIYMQTESFLDETELIESRKVSNSFSPTISSLGTALAVFRNGPRFSFFAGLSNRFRLFSLNVIASNIVNETEEINDFGDINRLYEPAAYFSSTVHLSDKLQLDAGLRLSGGIIEGTNFLVVEPRIRLALNPGGSFSPHINFVRLSQFDHSIEGSNAGLRSMLWVPVTEDFGPEVSDVFSSGIQGNIKNKYGWTIDGYYKTTTGMVDFKSGASFIFDTSFDDMLESIEGRAWGLETSLVKRKGKLTGFTSYTWSRSKREWGTPEGLIWIPTHADRPHSFNLSLKYHLKRRTSFGLNWVYQSGAPATIYMHNTSYGEWFDTKNNIRYFDYHRLDLSIRQVLYQRKFSILLDLDIYNVYNRNNTFYFLQTYDEIEERYYFKNISLFPVMPSISLTLKY